MASGNRDRVERLPCSFFDANDANSNEMGAPGQNGENARNSCFLNNLPNTCQPLRMNRVVNLGLRIVLALAGLCLLAEVLIDLIPREIGAFLIFIVLPLSALVTAFIAAFSKGLRNSMCTNLVFYSMWFGLAATSVAVCLTIYYGENHIPAVDNGMTVQQVQAKLGRPYLTHTNGDSGVSSWYKIFYHREIRVSYDRGGKAVGWELID